VRHNRACACALGVKTHRACAKIFEAAPQTKQRYSRQHHSPIWREIYTISAEISHIEKEI
jgi:hypothetical protein